jgi:hypothetical protein
MKQRHVIIEYIAVLHQTVRPGPNDMQVLRFITVESQQDHVPEFEKTSKRD